MRLFFRSPVCIVLASLILGACASDPTFSLEVFLRTDFQPLREFASVDVSIDSERETLLANIDGLYVRPGESLVKFDNLASSEARAVTVVLKRLGDAELLGTTVYIEQKKDLVLTVSVTRDCTGIACEAVNGLAQRCLGGKCVDARCARGDEDFCTTTTLGGVFECNLDSECDEGSPCALPSCLDGVCFNDGGSSANCPSNQVCDIEIGCVPAPDPGGCTPVLWIARCKTPALPAFLASTTNASITQKETVKVAV